MQIIPVLDIKNGVVVRGMMGDRANYRPIETPLSASPEPRAVAEGLLSLGDFRAFYIADLDAIEGRAANVAVVDALLEAHPGIEIWLDAGIGTLAAARDLLARPGLVVVLGSESLDGIEVAEALKDEPRAVLSLDYRGDAFVGPAALERRADLWPARVIAMTLAKVGSGAGPDRARLGEVTVMAGGRAVFAAGGVRDAGDLEGLRQAGIAGALVASALHDGRLDRAVLADLRAGRTG